jgi:hypothetical protein
MRVPQSDLYAQLPRFPLRSAERRIGNEREDVLGFWRFAEHYSGPDNLSDI